MNFFSDPIAKKNDIFYPLSKLFTEMTHFGDYFFFVVFSITAVWFGGNGLLFLTRLLPGTKPISSIFFYSLWQFRLAVMDYLFFCTIYVIFF